MSVMLSVCAHDALPGPQRSAQKKSAPVVTAAQRAQARQLIVAGRASLKQGQRHKALALFVKASQVDPDSALAWLEQATVLLSLGDDERSIAQALQQARRLAPDNPRVDFVSGRFDESFGRERQALAAYHAALQKRQSYPQVLYRAALLEEHFGQQDAAFAHYRRAYALQPDNSLAGFGAARIAVQRRDFRTGAMIYEALHLHFPKNRKFLERLIAVYKNLNESKKLRRYEREYQQRYGDRRHLRELRPSRR